MASIIVKSGKDCTILDYYLDGEIFSDGPFSLAVARYLRPTAEIREASNSTRPRYAKPTTDMFDRLS